jgi:iron(III) transport system substrate-binding protein
MLFNSSARNALLLTVSSTVVALLASAVPAHAATKTTTKATAKAAKKTTKRTAAVKTTKPGAPTTKPTVTTAATTTVAAAATTTATTAPTTAPKADPVALKGRKLVVYSGRAERLLKPIITQFEFATGVEVSVRYADSAELAATLLEEGDRTKANVFFAQDAGALGALTKEKRFAKIPAATLNRVDPKYRADDATWVGVSGRARVFVYDPRQISTPPKSIKDLIDPKYRGKVGYVPTNASFQSFVTALRVSAGEDAAKEWLTAFKNNRPVVYPSNGAVVVAANKGEIAVGLVNHYYLYERIAADGASNVYVRNEYPEKGDLGGLVNVAGVGILKDSAADPASLAFVEFMLGKEAQTYFAEKTFEYPLVPSVARHPSLPPIQTVEGPAIDLSKLDSLKQTLDLLRSVGML